LWKGDHGMCGACIHIPAMSTAVMELTAQATAKEALEPVRSNTAMVSRAALPSLLLVLAVLVSSGLRSALAFAQGKYARATAM
jgi:hypothetical protein